MVKALEILAKENFSNLNPHPLYENYIIIIQPFQNA